jgi:hypothetical protein
MVNTVPLADYITGPVDYLKVDIEGAEMEVMASIQSRLHLVRALGLEFHRTGARARADERALVRLLRRSGFEVTVTPKSDVIFPPEISGWVDRVQPYVSVLKAARTG